MHLARPTHPSTHTPSIHTQAMHALGLVPAAHMDPDQLSVAPEGTTPSPFELRQAKREQDEMVGGHVGGSTGRGSCLACSQHAALSWCKVH